VKSAPLALVTGASSGIGAEIARAFRRRGYNLVLLARDRGRLEELARDLEIEGRASPVVMTVDLSLPGSPQRVFADLQRRGLAVDILVNNAGVICEGDFVETEADDLLRLLQTNVVALTALTRVFAPAMKARGTGRILNVASIAAFAPTPRLAVYAAAKAYVLSFSEALAEELADSGVTVTALCPGFTETGMLERSNVGQSLPRAIVMSAHDVAERGCLACLAGERVCVPGLVNSMTALGARLAPRPVVRFLGGLGRRFAAKQDAGVDKGATDDRNMTAAGETSHARRKAKRQPVRKPKSDRSPER
jgi:short-subunit dehydrogenase